MIKQNKLSKKRIIIGSIAVAVICSAFFYPKEYTSCGVVYDGSECNKTVCYGIYSAEIGMSTRHRTCIGFDIGSSHYFVPYTTN